MFGGSSGFGTVFSLSADGTGFRTLHTFAFTDSYAQSALLVSGNTLYGTIAYGGRSGTGRIFKVNTDGTSFATLYSFSAFITNSTGVYTNSDGNQPRGLISWGNTLYGTAQFGGSSDNGTVFTVNTNGTGFTILHSFSAGASYGNCVYMYTNSDGVWPSGSGLIVSGSTLYGTAPYGGIGGSGTIFSISLPVSSPQLTIAPSGVNIILTWPTNAAGFTLQSAPAITGSFTNLPGATSPYTNAITASQQYFRLVSP